MNIVQFTLVFLIRLYQKVLGPVLPAILGPSACCRFTPTCSQYAAQAIRLHGAILGGWLAARRLCRCHPWGDAGEDPPPAAPLRWNGAFRSHGLRLPLLNLNPNPTLNPTLNPNPNPNPGCTKKIRIMSKIKIKSKSRTVTLQSEIRPRWRRPRLKADAAGMCHGP